VETFYCFDDLIRFANEEAIRTIRLPLKGLLEQGAVVADDQGIGTGQTLYSLNTDSFKALCHLTGTTPDFLQGLQVEGLASAVLNDVLASGRVRRDIDALEVVCDEENLQVVGFVSNRYCGYSNKTFLSDIMRCIDPVVTDKALFPILGQFTFKEGHSINTRMYLRLTSTKICGAVRGRGGNGEDRSEIGLQAFNSMAGGQAVRFSYFLHRLICANGLTAQVAGGAGRVTHTGTSEFFNSKLKAAADEVLKGMGAAARMIQTLGDLTFDSRKLARYLDHKELFSILPGRDLKEFCKRGIPKDVFQEIEDPKAREEARYALMIDKIPECIGDSEALAVFRSYFRENASMWDFINLFTAHAKTLPLADKLRTEERAGNLADWIAKNRRKFA
jgi:hypothetical protein